MRHAEGAATMAQCPYKTPEGRCQGPGESTGPPCSYAGADPQRECREYPLLAGRDRPGEPPAPPEPPVLPASPDLSGVPASSVPQAPSAGAEAEIAQLARSGQKIAAIKLMRERTGLGLREAKEAVEAIASGAPMPRGMTSPTPSTGGFGMTVDDVFSIAGRGTIVTGTIDEGVLRVGDDLLVVKPNGTQVATQCAGLEAFKRRLNEARAGDHVGVLLRDLGKEQLARGDVLRSTAPGQPSASGPGGSALAGILQARGISPVHPRVEEEVIALIRDGQRIPAIRALRDHSPLDLGGAKDVVEELGHTLGVPASSGKCFIATAACGSAGAAAVIMLREFRETVLGPTLAGRAFIRCYERLSPPLANAIEGSRALRAAVRHGVVSPAARAAGLWLRIAGRARRPPPP